MAITIIIIGILFFLVLVLGIGGYYSSLNTFKRRDIDRRLKVLSEPRGVDVSIVRSRVLSEIPWLNNILLRIPLVTNIDRILKQAGIIRLPVGFFILLSLVFGIFGGYLGWYTSKKMVITILFAVAASSIPIFYVRIKKVRRVRRFTNQLPDALDTLARAMRAGHAFSSGLSIVAQELPDPIGPEFAETFAEINYGLSVPEALGNLADRVDCKDLTFFVVSVVVQRETGGNLAETLENTAYIIRERFKLLGKIKALAAEGVYSAWFLGLLPFVMALVLYFLSRDYILFLVNDPSGQIVVLVGLVWLAVGIYLMRAIVTIKV